MLRQIHLEPATSESQVTHVSVCFGRVLHCFRMFLELLAGQVTGFTGVQASSFNIIQDCGHETSQRLAGGFQNDFWKTWSP